MDPKYAKWIANKLAIADNNGYGLCADWTAEMVAAFPELTRVRGHYYCAGWGEREHWWCTTADGTIVDPTAQQFPSKGRGHYEPWDETQPEPTGMCPNCGGYCFGGSSVCSDRCEHEYIAYLDNPMA